MMRHDKSLWRNELRPERWLPVPGWGDRYEVSDQGRVRGLVGHNGKPRDVPHIMVLAPTGPKHLKKKPLAVRLHRPGRKLKCMTAHRLALLAFVGPCPAGMQARHLNDDRHDNRIENLRWGTPLENAADARRNGIRRTGERNGRSKLTEGDVKEIRRLRGEIAKGTLAERYGVHVDTIGSIQRRRTWPHVA